MGRIQNSGRPNPTGKLTGGEVRRSEELQEMKGFALMGLEGGVHEGKGLAGVAQWAAVEVQVDGGARLAGRWRDQTE